MKKNRYRIRYRDQDPGCPIFSLVVNAATAEEAELKFWDLDDPNDDGWDIVSITLAGK